MQRHSKISHLKQLHRSLQLCVVQFSTLSPSALFQASAQQNYQNHLRQVAPIFLAARIFRNATELIPQEPSILAKKRKWSLKRLYLYTFSPLTEFPLSFPTPTAAESPSEGKMFSFQPAPLAASGWICRLTPLHPFCLQ